MAGLAGRGQSVPCKGFLAEPKQSQSSLDERVCSTNNQLGGWSPCRHIRWLTKTQNNSRLIGHVEFEWSTISHIHAYRAEIEIHYKNQKSNREVSSFQLIKASVTFRWHIASHTIPFFENIIQFKPSQINVSRLFGKDLVDHCTYQSFPNKRVMFIWERFSWPLCISNLPK
jgi:hypothetical protein